MPKKARKVSARSAGRGSQRTKPKGAGRRARAAPGPAATPVITAAGERFVSGLLVRGEAAARDKRGKLPLQATHVIKRRKRDGSAEVERVRFKTF